MASTGTLEKDARLERKGRGGGEKVEGESSIQPLSTSSWNSKLLVPATESVMAAATRRSHPVATFGI